MDYYLRKIINIPFQEAVTKVTEALKKEGFGILTKIDVQEKFKEKLGIDFKKYLILGACRPDYAHKAILAEENIGVMLPCNVVVYEKDGETAVAVIKPTAAMDMIEKKDLKEIALQVENRLKNALDSVS